MALEFTVFVYSITYREGFSSFGQVKPDTPTPNFAIAEIKQGRDEKLTADFTILPNPSE
jgi:hypothetical protein